MVKFKLKSILALFLVMGLLTAGQSQDKTEPAKKDEANKQDVKKDATQEFTGICIQGCGKVVLHQTGKISLAFKGDPKLQEQIQSDVRDGILYLQGPDGAELHVEVKEITRLQIEGSGSLTAKNLKGKRLAMTISGSGSMDIAGAFDDQEFTINGSGDIKGEGLAGKQAKVQISGSGFAGVQVADNLNVTIQGSGTVEYSGAPKIETNISGEGHVKKREPSQSLDKKPVEKKKL